MPPAATRQLHSRTPSLTCGSTRRHPEEGPEERVTDEGVRWLVNLPALTALDIGGSNVTDRGVEKLASCLTLSLGPSSFKIATR